MPTLDQHQSNSFVKLLLIGDAKTGKTGSLVSLVKAGYKLHILDFDNLLDILKYMVQKECPELLEGVEYITIRDKYKIGPMGMACDGRPTAWVQALKTCDNWPERGAPADWGPDHILVIDSLSRLCDAAYNYHEAIIPSGKKGDYDGRAVYGNAQDDVEKFLAKLTSESMQTNVIVIAHVHYQSQPDGSLKGFPQGVGQKLSPRIPQYFPTVIYYTNRRDKRVFQTNSTSLIDLSNPRPFAMQPQYHIETGLAEFFAVLRDPPAKEPPPTDNDAEYRKFVVGETRVPPKLNLRRI